MTTVLSLFSKVIVTGTIAPFLFLKEKLATAELCVMPDENENFITGEMLTFVYVKLLNSPSIFNAEKLNDAPTGGGTGRTLLSFFLQLINMYIIIGSKKKSRVILLANYLFCRTKCTIL